MLPRIGIDKAKRCWFKSDQFLRDITDADYFFVKEKGWWKKCYHVIARYQWTEKRYPYDKHIRDILLGVFPSQTQASLALEDIMQARKIECLDIF